MGEVVTVMDERDKADLADHEAEVESDAESLGFEQIKVTKRVSISQVVRLAILYASIGEIANG